MHVLAVHVAADLIEPGVGVEPPRIDDQSVAFPAGDAFAGVGAVQFLQRRVFAAVGRNHAVHGLRRNQAALPRIDEHHVGGELGDVRRNAGTRDACGHAVVRRVLFVGVAVVVLHHVPVFRLVDRSVRSAAPEQRRRAFRLLVVLRAIVQPRKHGDELAAVQIARDGCALDRDAVVGDLVRHAVQVVAERIPDAGEIRMSIGRARRRASRLRRRVGGARPLTRSASLREKS